MPRTCPILIRIRSSSTNNTTDCYTRCLDGGYPKAGYRLGMMHLEGRGVPANADKASKFFIKAADMGSEDAMCMLGKMSLSGEGMVKSVNNARKWLQKAAIRGSQEAASILEGMQ